MSAAHHPGPWVPQAPCNAATARHVRILSDAGEVAIVTWAGSERATDANAAAVAATPDLLAALQRLLADGDVRDAAEKGALTQARAAIAKATGEARP